MKFFNKIIASTEIDQIYNFKIYFPKSNCSKIIQEYNKIIEENKRRYNIGIISQIIIHKRKIKDQQVFFI